MSQQLYLFFICSILFLSPWVVICKPGIRQSLIPRAAAAWIIYSPKNRLNSFSNAIYAKGPIKNIFTVFPSHSPKVKALHILHNFESQSDEKNIWDSLFWICVDKCIEAHVAFVSPSFLPAVCSFEKWWSFAWWLSYYNTMSKFQQ